MDGAIVIFAGFFCRYNNNTTNITVAANTYTLLGNVACEPPVQSENYMLPAEHQVIVEK